MLKFYQIQNKTMFQIDIYDQYDTFVHKISESGFDQYWYMIRIVQRVNHPYTIIPPLPY